MPAVVGRPAMEYRPVAGGYPSLTHAVRPCNGRVVALMEDDESVTNEEHGCNRDGPGAMLRLGLCRRFCAFVGRLRRAMQIPSVELRKSPEVRTGCRLRRRWPRVRTRSSACHPAWMARLASRSYRRD